MSDRLLEKLKNSGYECILEEDCPYEKKIEAILTKPAFLRFITNKTLELCKLAIQNDPFSIYYIPEEHKNYEMCMTVVQDNGCLLQCVPNKHKTLELCTNAVKNNRSALNFVPKEHMSYELCKIAVQKKCYDALKFVPKEFINYELCIISIQNGGSLNYIPKEFIDYELCMIAIKNKGNELSYVPEELKTPELCLIAVQQNGYILKYVPEKYITLELCMIAVQKNRKFLKYVPEIFKNSVLLNINKIIPTNFISLPESIRKEELIDPLTFEEVQENTIYAFFKENDNFYIVTSLHTIQKMVNDSFRGSNDEKVFVPSKNSLMDISELYWVRF